MRILIAIAMVFSLLTATFAAATASADMASDTGCVSVESAEFCLDPNALPTKSGSTDKSSKCLGPYLPSGTVLLCLPGTHAHASHLAMSDDGLSPPSPKRPPRV